MLLVLALFRLQILPPSFFSSSVGGMSTSSHQHGTPGKRERQFSDCHHQTDLCVCLRWYFLDS